MTIKKTMPKAIYYQLQLFTKLVHDGDDELWKIEEIQLYDKITDAYREAKNFISDPENTGTRGANISEVTTTYETNENGTTTITEHYRTVIDL